MEPPPPNPRRTSSRQPTDSICCRLLWRAYSVVQTSNDVLVDKLGLDIPPPPELTLEEIFSTEVRIAWKHSEQQNTIQKHLVEVNGLKGWLRFYVHEELSLTNIQLGRRSDLKRLSQFSTLYQIHPTMSESSQ